MERTYPYGQDAVKLVSTEWLDKNLVSGEMTVLDVQPNMHDYIMEHLPASVYLNENIFRLMIDGVPGRYAPKEAIEAELRLLGVSNDKPTVIYTGVGAFKGWGDGLEQTMAAYSLARFGHRNVLLLDGGLDKWKAEGRELSKEYGYAARGDFTAAVQEEFYVDYDEFKAIKDNDHVMVVDARPAETYQGQGIWMKPGHIPGAINLPWDSLVDSRNPTLLRSDSEIQNLLQTHGIDPEKTIICMCGTGREATIEFLLFKSFLNYPSVKLFEGSFNEWVAHPENETVTGPYPRAAREEPVPF
jgi:thiosulfate/3-mercaptopyruvate sulfurtransferase